MKTYRSLGELPLGGGRRSVAIGSFDGVHLGHRAIIATAVEQGTALGIPSTAITFEPHPIAVLRPHLRPTVLTPLERKAELIAEIGVDELLVLPFTRAFARVRADRFIDMIGSPPLGAEVIVVGENFRFGHGGAGTAEAMRAYGRSNGIVVEIPPMVSSADGKPISSTRIRRIVGDGRVEEAAELLGRPHRIVGPVVPGDQRGRELGLPTANIDPPADTAIPGRGVYAARALLDDTVFPAAVNVGLAPTFREKGERPPLRVEAFLVGYEGPDLYERIITLDVLARLRDEQRFDGPDELVAQIKDDIARTVAIAAE